MTAFRASVPTLLRAGGWMLFGLLLLLCVLPKGSTRIFTWPWVFYAQLLMLAPVLLAGWVQFKSTRGLPGCLAMVFCATSSGLSVALSRNPHFSFEAALYLWGGLGLIWWLADQLREAVSNDDRFRAMARAVGFTLAAPVFSSFLLWSDMIVPGLVTATTPGEVIATFSARNPHPFGHWNYTGAYGLIAFPWFVVLAWTERGRWRVGWAVAAVLCPILIYSSASRGAVLGAVVMLGSALVLGLLSGNISRRSGFSLLIAGAVLASFLALTNARLRALLTDPSGLQYPSLGDVQRVAMLQGGMLLGLQRPWVGHGPGMVPFVYPEVRAELVGGVETSYQLHNAYLHHWVTMGFLGIAAGLTLAIVLVNGTRRWIRQPRGLARTFAIGSASALLGYAGMAATDYQLDVIGIVAALSLHAGLLLAAPQMQGGVGRDNGGRGANPNSRSLPSGSLTLPEPVLSALSTQLSTVRATRLSGVLMIGCALAAVGILVPHWRARQLHWSAWTTTSGTHRLEVLSKFLSASNAAPWNTHYRNQFGLQLAQDALASNQPHQRGLARDAFGYSVALDAAQEPIHANLAWLWLPDNPVNAKAEFLRALALLPDRETVHYGLAISCLNTGDQSGAIRALALECLVNPTFLVSPLWLQSELAVVQDQVKSELKDLLRRAAAHPAMPPWRQRDLVYFRAFIRWWEGGARPAGDELAGGTEQQRAFFGAVSSDPGAEATLPALWQELNGFPSGNPASNIHGPVENTAVREGIEARRQSGARTLTELIRSRPPPGVGVIASNVERAHYPLMHRNLDGPGYLDLAPRVVDAFWQRYAEPLFPARGLIPGAALKDFGAEQER